MANNAGFHFSSFAMLLYSHMRQKKKTKKGKEKPEIKPNKTQHPKQHGRRP